MNDKIQQAKAMLTKVRKLLRHPRWFSIFAILMYLFFVAYYMGPTTWSCSDTLAGIGDSTGGPIWRASLEPDQPLLGGPQRQTNFPSGESLYSPVGYAIIVQTLIVRGLDAVAGPVCAYNILNIIGYLSTAIVMFAFVYYLLGSRWIAFLAGYAVAFTPYVQSKTGGHPSYGYASLLIGALWLTLHSISTKKYRYGIALGSLLALCGYFDPYFILLSGVVVAPTVAIWICSVLYDRFVYKEESLQFIKTLKVLAVGFGTLLVLLSPLVYIRIREAAAITATVGPTRSNISAAAELCSNYIPDYILPDPFNTHLVTLFGQDYTRANIGFRNWCGPGESRVSLSITLLLIATTGVLVYIIRKRRLPKKEHVSLMNYRTFLVVGSLVSIGIGAFLVGLPPQVKGIITPSGIIISLTETWRIFARLYLVINFVLVIFASIMLAYLYGLLEGRWKKAAPFIFAGLLFVIVAEYQIFSPFDPFNFEYPRDVPKIYRTIRDSKNINAIAEYPIDRMGTESDVIVYYTTMQFVHRKPVLNSALVNNPNDLIHVSIKDLTDPQTLPVLRGLGISYLTIHGVGPDRVRDELSDLEIISVETPKVYGIQLLKSSPSNTIVLAKIKPGAAADYTTVISKGYTINMNITRSPLDVEYEVLNDAELNISELAGRHVRGLQETCFDVKTIGKSRDGLITVTLDGRTVAAKTMSGTYQSFRFTLRKSDAIQISNSAGYNMRLNNLGCE